MLTRSELVFDPAEIREQGRHTEHAAGWEALGHVPTVTEDLATSIDLANRWNEPEDFASATDKRFQDAAEMLGTILLWFSKAQNGEEMANRGFAFVLFLRPDLLADTLDCPAKVADRLGVTRQALNKLKTQLFHLTRGVFSKTNRPHFDREKHSQIQKASHAKRPPRKVKFTRQRSKDWTKHCQPQKIGEPVLSPHKTLTELQRRIAKAIADDPAANAPKIARQLRVPWQTVVATRKLIDQRQQAEAAASTAKTPSGQ